MSGDDGTVTGRYHVLGTASCAGVKAPLGPKQVGQEDLAAWTSSQSPSLLLSLPGLLLASLSKVFCLWSPPSGLELAARR